MMRPATTDACWTLHGQSAELTLPRLTGTIDLSTPSAGLGNLRISDFAYAGSMLGVLIEANGTPGAAPGADVTHSAPLSDAYARGCDLIAVYDETDTCPFRTTVCWHVQSLTASTPAAALDLIVSVQTSLLDATPRLCTQTRLEAADAWGLRPAASADSQRSARVHVFDKCNIDAQCGLVAIPLPDADATYCEMIHPSDRRGLKAHRTGDTINLAWSLVGHFLEKGVIRRLRVRGVLIQGPPSDALLGELYSSFATSPPPLTT